VIERIRNRELGLIDKRPAPLVRSEEGRKIQQKLWAETLALFERELSVELNLD
jgi:hypothetical protein